MRKRPRLETKWGGQSVNKTVRAVLDMNEQELDAFLAADEDAMVNFVDSEEHFQTLSAFLVDVGIRQRSLDEASTLRYAPVIVAANDVRNGFGSPDAPWPFRAQLAATNPGYRQAVQDRVEYARDRPGYSQKWVSAAGNLLWLVDWANYERQADLNAIAQTRDELLPRVVNIRNLGGHEVERVYERVPELEDQDYAAAEALVRKLERDVDAARGRALDAWDGEELEGLDTSEVDRLRADLEVAQADKKRLFTAFWRGVGVKEARSTEYKNLTAMLLDRELGNYQGSRFRGPE